MNTRKTIRISMIALLVVALSVSMAAAESVDVSPGAQQLIPDQSTSNGVYSEYSIEVSQMPAGDDPREHTIRAEITGVSGLGDVTDLMFKFNHGSATSDWVASGTPWVWTDSGALTDSLTLYVMDIGSAPAVDITYQFKVYDEFQNGPFTDTAQGTVYGTSAGIPEFATLAIPVVALLGLVFFMRRKEQK